MEAPSNTPVVRDMPWGLWFFGLFVCSLGALIAQSTLWTADIMGLFIGAVLCGIGLLMIGLFSVLTVRADRENGLLTLTYRSLLTKRVKEIPLAKIDSINVEGYRVVITESDGRVTPLRSMKKSPAWQRSAAKRLREATGVGGSDGDVFRMLTGRDESVNQQIRRRQEELTGPNKPMSETVGVHWNVQSIAMGRQPVTHGFLPTTRRMGRSSTSPRFMPGSQPSAAWSAPCLRAGGSAHWPLAPRWLFTALAGTSCPTRTGPGCLPSIRLWIRISWH